MRNLLWLLLDAVSLFFFVDLSLKLAVDAAASVIAFILQAVLEQSCNVMEQTDRSHRCRPVLVASDAVQELSLIHI